MTSYMAEAQDMIAHIRSAEEAFRAENGIYLDVSGALGSPHLYPADPPGAFKTAWGASCTKCKYQWSQLNVTSQAPTFFSFAVHADNTGQETPALPALVAPSATSVDVTSLKSPWYIVQAEGDINGDKIYTNIYGFSVTPQLLVDNEGN
jgi:hypothetical protein